jgi:hypothetical protein
VFLFIFEWAFSASPLQLSRNISEKGCLPICVFEAEVLSLFGWLRFESFGIRKVGAGLHHLLICCGLKEVKVHPIQYNYALKHTGMFFAYRFFVVLQVHLAQLAAMFADRVAKEKFLRCCACLLMLGQ